jgi:hypothetical protein
MTARSAADLPFICVSGGVSRMVTVSPENSEPRGTTRSQALRRDIDQESAGEQRGGGRKRHV